jgi:hypothetical protein
MTNSICRMFTSRSKVAWRLGVALVLPASLGPLGLAASGAARAEIVAIAAPGLTQHGSAFGATEGRGVLSPEGPGRYFASVQLPNGQSVCSFSLVYRDVNAEEQMVAYLVKRTFAVGDAINSQPTVMAVVRTASGVVSTMRRATTTSITAPLVNNANGFFYVRVDAPNVNVNIVGLQIDVRPAC